MKIPRPEHPRPDCIRTEWLILNGIWDFKFDPGVSGYEQNWQTKTTFDRKIVVPFCMESSLSGVGYKDFMPAIWYHRTFAVPAAWEGKRVLFHIGACDFFTRVFINGSCVGEHSGGYASFSFDITQVLRRGKNTVTVEVRDDVRSGLQPAGKQCSAYASCGCSYTRTTGIWQTVWLEAVPKSYIRNFKITGDVDNQCVQITVFPGGDKAEGVLEATVTAKGKKIAAGKVKSSATATSLSLPIPDATLWSPEQPFLYDLELRLVTRHSTDSVKSYFGMRKIHAEGRKIFLNNQPLYMRTVLDQGFYPDGIYTAPTDAALIRDIQLSMAMGFNGARLHQKVFEPRFLYWADKMGYLVWGEAGNWGCNLNQPLAVGNFVDEWMQILERDYNHPSIIGWCPLNETYGQQGPLPRWLHGHLYQLNKALDPNRLAIDASGYMHYAGVGSDLYDVHNYSMPVKLRKELAGLKTGDWAKAFRNHSQDIPYAGDKPYFVSEFGGIGWNPRSKGKDWGYGDRPKTEKAFVERYVKTMQVLRDNPEICGWCYTQLTDVEQEVNGLYYYNRRPKFSPAAIRKIREANTGKTQYRA